MSRSHTFSLPLHTEVHGGEGDSILLLHGFGTNGFTWRRWVPDLARDYQVVVVEMKGFGNSPKPADDRYSPLDQAELLRRLVLQRNLTGLTLVGHSLGGGVALLTALLMRDTEPGWIRRMVILAGTAFPQPLSPWIRRASRPWLGPLLLRLLPSRLVVRKALELAYARPQRVTRSQVEAYSDPLRSPEGRRALVRSARQLIPPGIDAYTSRLGEIDVPTLLLWGREDRIVPLGIGERLATVLPRGRLEILPDCGHFPQEEEPEQSLGRVRRFLQEASGDAREEEASPA